MSILSAIKLIAGIGDRDAVKELVNEYDGGPGSGNWGHAGRPGKRGGSGKGGGSAYRDGNKESGFTKRTINPNFPIRPSKYSGISIPKTPERPRRADFDMSTEEGVNAFEQARAARKAAVAQRDKAINKIVDSVRPNDPMTINDAVNWANKRGDVELVTSGEYDASKVDPYVMAACTKRVGQLLDDYPIVNESLQMRLGRNYTIEAEETMDFEASAVGGIRLGSGGFRSFDAAYQSRYRSFSEGYLVSGDGAGNELYDHEFGHDLYTALIYGKKDSGYNEYDERDKMVMLTRAGLERKNQMKNDLISSCIGKDGCSEYATTNDDELFAEGFAAYYGGQKTEFAKAFGEFLGRWSA